MENSAYLALPLFAGLTAGDIPAALAALDALCRPFAKVSVVAAERGEALFLDPGKLMAPGGEPWRWQMMQNLLHILAGKNLNLARRSLYTAPKTIRERVTAYFSTLAVQKGSLEFELPFDRQQLADHLGVDRSALSSTLSAMQRDGLLTIDRRRVCLKKAEGL